ncbi:MAG: DUF2070 family protein [Ferroplasma sp.]
MQSEKTLAGLSKYVVRSPKWYYLAVPAIIIFLVDFIIIRSLLPLLLIGILPFVLLFLIDYFSIHYTNKSFNTGRIVYLDFISLVMASVLFWLASLFSIYMNMGIPSILAMAIAFPVFLRFLVFYIYYPSNAYIAGIFSMNYTYSYIIVSIIGFTFYYTVITLIVPLIIATLIYLLFSSIFLYFTVYGFTKKYHSKPSELIDFFLNRTNDGDIGEEFFRKVYNKKRKIPVMTINIKNEKSNIVTLIFPFVHPGPFGNLCTSNLPEKLARELENKNIMVFHTATTNSNNCSGANDLKNIAAAVKTSLGRIEYSSMVSDFVKFNVDGYDVSLQKFGDSAFSAVIPFKKSFDDISMESGLKVVKALRENGAKNFTLLDAQNSFVKDAEELKDCNFLIKPLIEKFNETKSEYPALIGYAQNYKKIDGMASMGVQVLALKIKDYYNAIVLTDSNNITRDIIKLVRSRSNNSIKKLDIYTTDNHVVNVGELDINPLGSNCNPDEVADLIEKTVNDAINNVQAASAGMDTEYVDVTMGDEGSFHGLIDTVLKAIKKAKYSIAFIMLISIVLSILSFHYVLIYL